LSKGKIIENGSHAELLELKGDYASMFEQASNRRLPVGDNWLDSKLGLN